MKIVINDCYGGFGLSDKCYERLFELGVECFSSHEEMREAIKSGFDDLYVYKADGIFGNYYSNFDSNRTSEVLIKAIEELGSSANGQCASLKIVEIPDGIEYEIEEYDGIEWVSEVHRTWS